MTTTRSNRTTQHRAAALLTLFALLLAGAERDVLEAAVHRPVDLGVGRRDAARQVVEQHPLLVERQVR